jgi:hypothetical protein
MKKYQINFWGTFYKGNFPDELPFEIQLAIEELKKTESREECLKKAYDLLTRKYKGHKFGTLFFPHLLFMNDLGKLWNKSGYIHCTQMNYLLRLLLVKSDWFKDEEIELKWTLIWFISPHQYCRVRIATDKYVNVDIWGKAQGFYFGDYAHGFHSPEKFETLIDFTKLIKGGVEIKDLLSRLRNLDNGQSHKSPKKAYSKGKKNH